MSLSPTIVRKQVLLEYLTHWVICILQKEHETPHGFLKHLNNLLPCVFLKKVLQPLNKGPFKMPLFPGVFLNTWQEGSGAPPTLTHGQLLVPFGDPPTSPLPPPPSGYPPHSTKLPVSINMSCGEPLNLLLFMYCRFLACRERTWQFLKLI